MLQSQLRTQLLAQLQQRKDVPNSDTGDRAAPSSYQRSLWTKAMDTLVAEHLRASSLPYTLSVLQSEAGGEGSMLSRDELAELLQLDKQPLLRQALSSAEQQGDGHCIMWMSVACACVPVHHSRSLGVMQLVLSAVVPETTAQV